MKLKLSNKSYDQIQRKTNKISPQAIKLQFQYSPVTAKGDSDTRQAPQMQVTHQTATGLVYENALSKKEEINMHT